MNTALMLEHFHFLRPLWLLVLLPALLLGLWLWRHRRQARGWEKLIDPQLLPHLLDGKSLKPATWRIGVLMAAWVLTCLALAGPAWEKRPLPVQKNLSALVVLFDLSPSMTSEDIKPSRLVRARLKLIDILRERGDGLAALLVYSGEAHAVVPLTDDVGTLISLVPSLHPNLMPRQGSNTEAAVERALSLLRDAGASEGDLLLITDGVADAAVPAIRRLLQNTRYRLSVMGVGGDTPAPIPGAQGNFLRDGDNNIVTTRLDEAPLRQLAADNNGRYARLASDNSDVRWLISQTPLGDELQQLEREFDNWHDRGYWLVLLLLPIVLYSFRRGVVLVVFLVPALSYTPQSQAMSWRDLWATPDQQGQRALDAGQATEAAELFEDPLWQASARYRAGDYQRAAEAFAQVDTAQAHYNRGNALARAGDLQAALNAYDKALEHQPDFPEAHDNRELVKRLLDQQQQQQDGDSQDNQDNQDQSDSDQQDSDQQQSNQQESNQDSSDQSDQQESDQQQSDQQQSDQQQDTDEQQDNQQSGENPTPEEQQDEQRDAEAQSSPDEQQADEEQAEQEHAAQPEDDANSEEEREAAAQRQQSDEEAGDEEQRQALEQWLRRVPDDPGGLLREKFRRDYQQQRQRNRFQDHNQEQRW